MPVIGDIDVTQPTFLLTELQTDALTEGKPFDGFAPGDFVDMRGSRILVEEGELEEYTENTLAAIEATRSESGEVVGLPIDIIDHDRQDAAGWIVDAQLEDGIIRFTANWTSRGKELIEEGIRRFFSATFSTEPKVIMGGSLTNWPASRDEERRVLLRPIELTTTGTTGGVTRFWGYQLQEAESQEDKLMRIRAAFDEAFPQFDNRPFRFVEETFDDFIIVSEAADHFRVGYTESDENEFVFEDAEQWVRVKSTWVEAARDAARKIFLDGPIGRATAALGRKPKKLEGKKMGNKELKLEDLTPEQESELALGLFAKLAGEDYKGVDLGQQFHQLVETRATDLVEKQTAIAARKKDIVDFSQGITGGTDESPTGIPVKPEEVEAFLAMLSDDALEVAKGIFSRIQTEGLVSFSENGHGRHVDGQKELPEEYADKLDNGDFKVEDLKDPVLGLGDLSAYNLSKWTKKETEA